jgi:hypothetical protein
VNEVKPVSTRVGSCICGAVSYRARGEPERTSVCHCTYCQRLTGSACAVWVSFRKENVELAGVPRAVYEHHSDESRRWIRSEFCPRCGTTIGSTFERAPELYALAGGTFDDTGWIEITRHVWTRSAQHWMVIPSDVPAFPKSPQTPTS